MKDKIFKLRSENVGHYDVRLLPNINNLNRGPNKLSFKYSLSHLTWDYVHVCYALINNEIKIFVCSDLIMQKIEHINYYKQKEYWSVTKNKYLDINTSIINGYFNIVVDFGADNKYNFNNKREVIENAFDTIKHIKLQDVMYFEMFKRAHRIFELYDDTKVKMVDVYAQEYYDFEERYFAWLRNEKIKQIIG